MCTTRLRFCSKHSSKYSSQYIEADAFWCLHAILVEDAGSVVNTVANIGVNILKLTPFWEETQDDFEEGIHAYLRHLEDLILSVDPELAEHLTQQVLPLLALLVQKYKY